MRGVATETLMRSVTSKHPTVTSYDSGDEHSLEHWLTLKQLVEAAAGDSTQASLELLVS